MNECRWCYRGTVTRTDELCDDCGRWNDYWSSLTPEQHEAELAMMDTHVIEQER